MALIDPNTGQEYARLEDPNQDGAAWCGFTPDGTQLVTSSSGDNGYAVHVWNLRLIRQQLAEMGLDWAQTAYAPQPEAPRRAVVPERAEIVGLELATDLKQWQNYDRIRTFMRLRANPFDVDAHFLLGRDLVEQRRYEPARQHLSFALALQPDFSPARLPRAIALANLKDWKAARTDLTTFHQQEPTHPFALEIRAQVNQRLNRHAEAIDDFNAVIQRYPRVGEPLRWRADSYAALGKKSEAEADRKKARELGSFDATELNNLAWQLVTGDGKRDPVRALRLIRQAIQQQPNNPTFLNTLGVVQYRNEMYQEARATLERSLAEGNGDSDAYDLFFLAACHARLGDNDKAKDCFDRAAKWMSEKKDLSASDKKELSAFRAEAEQVLRVGVPAK